MISSPYVNASPSNAIGYNRQKTELDFPLILKIILIGLISGTLIGTVGVGGILLTPLLVFFVGTDLHISQASSSFSFLFTGIVGTIVYARQKSISWSHVLWISIGILPATVFGAKVNTSLSSPTLTLILAILIMFSGRNALRKPPEKEKGDSPIHKVFLVLIGLGVGFGSSLTGTGGPVLLVPLLLLLSFLPLTAVGISQAIQLPIAVFATIGFMLFGKIDYALGITLGLVQAVGVVFGGKIAHTLLHEKLRRVVALTLVGVGMLLVYRVLF